MYLSEDEERRFVLRLLEYWQAVRGDRALPRLADINFNDLGKDAASCVLLRLVGEQSAAAVFTRLGIRLRPEGWRNPATDGDLYRVADCPAGSLLAELIEPLDKMLERGVPFSTANTFTVWGRPAVGRRILLPLSDCGSRITHVMGGINFTFADTALAVEPARL